ncbi:MAG: hypothetical protein Q9193_003958, partial [Seirophora villosa]
MGQTTLRDLDSNYLNHFDTINTSVMAQHESSGRLLLPDPLSTDVFPFMHLPPAILRVSKTVYAEASPIHYQEYDFVVAEPFIYRNNPVPLGKLISHRELPPGAEALDFSSATEAKLVEDVSKIFTKHRKDLPKCLFGAAYVRNHLRFRSVADPTIPGYDIARYLRQIGSQNAVEIRSLRIKIPPSEVGHLSQACYELSLYSTIIRQHIYNVRDIVL